jgi:hypothetical protein
MSVLATDNHGAGPDPNAPIMRLPVTANPQSETVLGRAAEIQAQTNEAFGKHLEHIREVGRKYTDAGRAAITPQLLEDFYREPIWQQVQEVESQAEQRVAELEQQVANERRALTPDLDTAGELRQQRAIDRAQRELSRAPDGWKIKAAAKMLRDAADPDVGILVQELPGLIGDDAQSVAEVLEPAIRERAPEYAAAQQKLAKAQRGAAIIRSNQKLLRQAIVNEHRQSVGILGLQLPKSGNHDPDA